MRPSAPNREYRLIKGLRDVNETGDLLIVRDVMMHWPNSEIQYFTDNILPNFRYALLTNGYNTEPVNYDIKPGQYRHLNLEYLPNQKEVLETSYGGPNRKMTNLVTNPHYFP